ncbi:MAG: VOC family protein [Longimicrobiales bacterium]
MSVKLNPYINFERNAREAMDFYHSVFGGNLVVSTFKDGGMPSAPADADLIMHSQLDADDNITLMASDTPPGMEFRTGGSMGISLSGNDEAKLRGYWEKLSAGGVVVMPLEKAPWGDTFGMCADRFQTNWLVNISGK